jgi:multicomponent Na+:H+ antiporter subunit B
LKTAPLILVSIVGLLMVYASFGLPFRADTNAAMNRDTSAVGSVGAANYYIRNSLKDANTPNMVTVILADYRGYDTLGETTVVFTAGLVCYMLLRRKKNER